MSRPGFPGLAEEALARFGVFRFRARGHSMRPFIVDGALVTLVPLSQSPSIGDVIAWARGPHLVVHRVVTRDGARLRTAGDNTLKLDPPMPESSVLGRVSRVEWPNGWVLRLDVPLSRGLGWVLSRRLRRRFRSAG